MSADAARSPERSPVWMYIAKFGGQVLIDPDHPLAVAQRAADAAAEAAASEAIADEAAPRKRSKKASSGAAD